MIQTWEITASGLKRLKFNDETSLDAVTRQLQDGYYSTFRTYDNCTRVIGLSAHLRRLPRTDADLLRRNLILLLEPYRPGEARVRVMESENREVFISIERLAPPPPDVYKNGVHVETTEIQRRDPRVKSTAFISASDDKRKHLAREGIFEALLVKNGRILEGMTSNFFYVLDGILCTARRDILLGVTRGMVIRAARGRGVEVRYAALKLKQLQVANEAFITSSSRGVVPVIRIDDVWVGAKVGKVTKRIMRAYEDFVTGHAELIADRP